MKFCVHGYIQKGIFYGCVLQDGHGWHHATIIHNKTWIWPPGDKCSFTRITKTGKRRR